MPRSGLLFGNVMHRRLDPFVHAFRYRLYALLLDLDDAKALSSKLGPLFGYNSRGLLSFYDKDHGPRDGSDLKLWAAAEVKKAGSRQPVSRVRIVCFPRVFGYVFNPLSVWFCENDAGHVHAILYEVNNTFGERRSYLFTDLEDTKPGQVSRHSCDKDFHVSPFFDVDGGYAFRTRIPTDRYDIGIKLQKETGRLFAAQSGELKPLGWGSALRALAAYPLLTFGVVAAIHWEALRLVIKGAKYHSKPKKPPVPDVVAISPPRYMTAAE